MLMHFDLLGDVRLRLGETIVRYKGEPVYVANTSGNGTGPFSLEVAPLTNTEKRITVKMEEVDLTPVPLGYINNWPFVCYLMRVPQRKYQQGLRIGELRTPTPGYRSNVTRNLPALYNTIMGIYPSFDEAYTLAHTHNACAFHRAFALKDTGLRNEMCLCYKEREIGRINEEGGFTLEDKYNNIRMKSFIIGELKNVYQQDV